MIRYYLRLRALSPLSITSHQNVTGQVNTTLTYIPGPTLRGAIAWKWLREDPSADQMPEFQRLFADAGLRCGPLYPLASPVREAGATYAADLGRPLPVTARTCKREAGFQGAVPTAEQGHGVVDTLAAALQEVAARRLRAEHEEPPEEWIDLSHYERCGCDECGARMDRLGGFYQQGERQGDRWFRQIRPPTRLITRTAILGELGTTKPEDLFSRQTLEAGQEFAGFLEVIPQAEADLNAALSAGTELYVGAARTAGLGHMEVVEVQPDWGVLTHLLGPVPDRQQDFEAKLPASLRQRWTLVPLTLFSDTILLDARLRYTSAPEPDVLYHYAWLEGQIRALRGAQQSGDAVNALDTSSAANLIPAWPEQATLFLAMGRPKRIAGWNTASEPSRPRSDDWAIAAGSVFVLAAPPDQADALLDACTWLEEHGLGERREEGFGRVVVAHPFHTEVTPI